MKKRLSFIYNSIKKLKERTKIFLLMLFIFLVWFWFCLPDPLFNEPDSFVLEDSKGELLGATIASDGQWRFPYSEDVPDKFKACIIAFEDKRFLYHPGVDLLAIGRAMRQNIQSSKTVSGGSTLTMQVIRLSEKRKRNIFSKLLESVIAVRLELSYSKQSILAMYASHAPFGSNVVGLDAAAWRYYGRGADKLSWGEMAALAVLPNAPALVHPGKNRQDLLRKRNLLLDRLMAHNELDSATCQLSKLEPLPDEPKSLPQWAPHLLQRFKKEARNNTDHRTRTTIQLNLQKTVSQIVEQHHRFLKGNGINNACALVLDVETGAALAYVGNAYHPENTELQSHVDIISSARSPGSTLKPLLYAYALSDGLILPHSLVPDIPTQIGGYSPQNFDREYDGAVTASVALSRSLNVPTVRILRNYKHARFYENLKKNGITTLHRPADHYGLSLILGGCEVTPWDLAGVYASFSRSLLHARKNNGKIASKDFHAAAYTKKQINPAEGSYLNFLDATSIWYMFNAMEDVMRPGEEGLWKQFSSSQRVAWKTGTSFGFRDAWAVGVTPRHVIVTWVGNGSGEGRPGLIGVQTAAPIMFDILKALPAASWFEKPTGGTLIPVCRQSQLRANIDCNDIDSLTCPPNNIHAPLCNYHHLIHLDETQQYRVTENCTSPSDMTHQSWFILPPTMEWYYRRKHLDYKIPPPFKQGCFPEGRKSMEIIYPEANAKIYVPVELTGEKGKTVFTAAHQKPDAKIFWHLDDEFIGSTERFHQMALNPARGKHFITVVDETGERITRSFEILDKE